MTFCSSWTNVTTIQQLWNAPDPYNNPLRIRFKLYWWFDLTRRRCAITAVRSALSWARTRLSEQPIAITASAAIYELTTGDTRSRNCRTMKHRWCTMAANVSHRKHRGLYFNRRHNPLTNPVNHASYQPPRTSPALPRQNLMVIPPKPPKLRVASCGFIPLVFLVKYVVESFRLTKTLFLIIFPSGRLCTGVWSERCSRQSLGCTSRVPI